ncbi:Helicase associated domain protein [Mycobacterium bourgelatii]|nr:Helicase associated domain protein [Mycobacterium bourgelatii]
MSMQHMGGRSHEDDHQLGGTFAERARAARLRADLTQQQLSDRLSETRVKLDTSAITRIEAGQREPRLGEALAIAQVLGFSLNNLAPRANLDFYIGDVNRLMNEARAALVRMIRSVDPVADFVRRNPDCLGDQRLEDRFRDMIDRFLDDISFENQAVTRNRSDEKLKRQLLRAVSEDILVKADDIPPAHERWFKDDISAAGSTTGGWLPVQPTVHPDEWQRQFNQLRTYVNQHGDARVPRTYVTPDGNGLGAWVAEQRQLFARDLLDPKKAAKLEKLPGWRWTRNTRANTRTRTSGSG